MQSNIATVDTRFDFDLGSLLNAPFQDLTEKMNSITDQKNSLLYKNLRLYHIDEISLDDSTPPREALENVFASTDIMGGKIVYLLVGREDGVDFHFGTVSENEATSAPTGQSLEGALQGNFSGIEIKRLSDTAIKEHILTLGRAKNVGMLLGVPSFNKRENDEHDYQGIDRVISGMLGYDWQLLIVAEPGDSSEIRETLDVLYSLSSKLHLMSKQTIQSAENKSNNQSTTAGKTDSRTDTDSRGENKSKTTTANKTVGSSSSSGSSSNSSGTSDSVTTGDSGTVGSNSGKSEAKGISTSHSLSRGESTGSGTTVSFEHTNKKLTDVVKHLDETLMPRFQLGRAKAMFKTSVYVFAEQRDVLTRAGGLLRALFQGDDSHFTPIEFRKLQRPLPAVESYFDMHHLEGVERQLCCLHSIPMAQDTATVATWMTTRELSLIAGLPAYEVPGLRLRQSVDFGVNILAENKATADSICLGQLKLRGRQLKQNPFIISQKMLNAHVFVTGVTGAGKTKTCQRLLLESGLPFLVLEPAKTEYRELLENDRNILFFTPGAEELAPFRFNPFELLKGESLSGHIDMLKAAFTASFPMEAAMPHLIEQGLVAVYEKAGWDIHRTTNFRFEEREWSCNGQCWPTLDEFLESLSLVIGKQGLGRELEEKYRGSLQARLGSLLVGAKGKMLNTRNSEDFSELIKHKVVIELEEIRDEGDKALLMGLIVGRLAEEMKLNHKRDTSFQHLTLIEEAHRLLSRSTGQGDDPRAHAVGLFTNLLAEVRKYGEGLIIADQIPNKLAPEVIKNTNTKIVHRLFARDDKDAMGDAMGLDDEQKAFLSNLKPGEAIAFSGGWHKPVRVQIEKLPDSNTEIDYENTIREKSGAYRWEQREKLYPWFPVTNEAGFTRELLTALLQDGEQIITHLVQLLVKKNDDDYGDDYATRHWIANHKLLSLKNRFTENSVTAMLTGMILNAIPVKKLELSLRPAAELHIRNMLTDICAIDHHEFKTKWVDTVCSLLEIHVICKQIGTIKL